MPAPDTTLTQAGEPPPVLIPISRGRDQLFVRLHPNGDARLFLRRHGLSAVTLDMPRDAVVALVAALTGEA